MDLQIIPFSQIKQGKKLGEGGFGIVYAGTWNYHEVAIKTLRMTSLNKDLESEFLREAKVMSRLNNPGIARLYGIYKNLDAYGMVLEYLSGGDLYHLLSNQNKKLPWQPHRWSLAIDIGSGLSYLHAHKILHRDLKSPNILLDQNLRAKITDFGLSKLKNTSSSLYTAKSAGSLNWMAPEMFKRGNKGVRLSSAIDVYAYGMVLSEIASRKIPFAEDGSPALIPTWVQQGERPEIPENCPKEFAEVIKDCWAQAPTDRPTTSQALQKLIEACPKDVKILPQSKVKVVEQSFVEHQTSVSIPPQPKGDVLAQPLLKNNTIIVVPNREEVPGPEDYKTAWKFMQKCDYRAALHYLQKAAEDGYPPAYMRLWWLYAESGRVGPQDKKRMGMWYEKMEQCFSWFVEEAKKGHPHIQSDLAFYYYSGIGVERNPELAYKFYALSSDQNDASGHLGIAYCYLFGVGLAKSIENSREFYEKAAHAGNVRAQWELGSYYFEHKPPNYDLGIKYYRMAVNKGYAVAQCKLGEAYFSGMGVEKNITQAIRLITAASEQGYLPACRYLKKRYQDSYNAEMAIKYCVLLVEEHGMQSECWELGEWYRDGRFVKKNLIKAWEYFNRAAKGSNKLQWQLGEWYRDGLYIQKDLAMALAYFNRVAEVSASHRWTIGEWYRDGKYVKKDLAMALVYFNRAAEDESKFHWELGTWYGNGKYIKKNLRRALAHLTLAANKGHTRARYQVGRYYYNGLGTPVNYVKAVKCWSSIYDKDASYSLGTCYQKGHGVKKNEALAKKHYEDAARQGHEGAKKILEGCTIL